MSDAPARVAGDLGARIHLSFDHFTIGIAVLVALLVLVVLCASRYRETGERGDRWYTLTFFVGTLWQIGELLAHSLLQGSTGLERFPLVRIAGHLLLGGYLICLLVSAAILPRRVPGRGAQTLVALLIAGLGLTAVLALAGESVAARLGSQVSTSWELMFHVEFFAVALVGLLICGFPHRPQHWALLSAWLLIGTAAATRVAELRMPGASPVFEAVGDSAFLLHLAALVLALALRERTRWQMAQGRLQTQFSELIGALDEIVQSTQPHGMPGSASAGELARDLGRNLRLDEGHCEAIYRAALVRDLGKMFLDRSLYSESRRLTPSEWTLVKAHPVEGARVLSRIGGLEEVARIVLHHHEHWDGSGYPEGLRGLAIPIGSRIVGLVDALEALIGGRPYQAPQTVLAALSTVRSMAGSHFDPEVVRSLTDVLETRGVPTEAVDGTPDAVDESA